MERGCDAGAGADGAWEGRGWGPAAASDNSQLSMVRRYREETLTRTAFLSTNPLIRNNEEVLCLFIAKSQNNVVFLEFAWERFLSPRITLDPLSCGFRLTI